jgi:hypothetical protein
MLQDLLDTPPEWNRAQPDHARMLLENFPE